jgi:hypothetical protein
MAAIQAVRWEQQPQGTATVLKPQQRSDQSIDHL